MENSETKTNSVMSMNHLQSHCRMLPSIKGLNYGFAPIEQKLLLQKFLVRPFSSHDVPKVLPTWMRNLKGIAQRKNVIVIIYVVLKLTFLLPEYEKKYFKNTFLSV